MNPIIKWLMILSLYFRINKYLMLCRRKLEVNKAINNLKK